ncbi:MAG: DUF5060 domain-containing protein, partial [Pseudomonadota bacterium]
GSVFATENVAPFALGGDSNGDFNSLNLAPGSYQLEATAYSGADGSGSAGAAASVSFELVQAGASSLSAGPDRFLMLPENSTTLNGEAQGSATLNWIQVEGPNSATVGTPDQVTTGVSGLVAGYYVFELSNGLDDFDRVVVAVADPAATSANLIGTAKPWYPLTLTFDGPAFSESDLDPNPFVDRRLQVWLRAPDGSVWQRPGFFNGDGNGGGTGTSWVVRFSPDQAGTWHYVAAFRSGSEVAVALDPAAGTASDFSGASGSFLINPATGDAPGFLKKGRLEYVGEHYLRFADGDYWIKGGTDSPENFLAFEGFDNLVDQGNLPPGGDFLHTYGPHIADWQTGDPDWDDQEGRGIIGALNYLASVDVNSIYFLPMNLGGDGQDTYPFLSPAGGRPANLQYDISKLSQWNRVFEHAQARSIALHFVLNETEGPNENWLDNGTLGLERRLFYRELIARFGHHLALKWNLSEENDYSVAELRHFAGYIQAQDERAHPITVHTKPNNFRDYDDLLGDPLISTTSIQYNPDLAGAHVENWRAQSAAAGRPWVLDMDENNPAGTGLNDGNADNLRKRVLYDVYFSGGHIEWYAGYWPRPPDNIGGDITLEDFRTREEMWNYMGCARRLMQDELPFWRMQPDDDRLSGESTTFGGGEVFRTDVSATDEVYAIYLPDVSPSGSLSINNPGETYRQRWFNPRNCSFGDSFDVVADATISLGSPPDNSNEDWVVLIERTSLAGLFKDRFEGSQ